MKKSKFFIASICFVLSSLFTANAQWTNTSPNIWNTNSGNVGVGTTPSYKFQVSGGEIACVGTNAGFRVKGGQFDNVNLAPWYGLGLSNLSWAGGITDPHVVQLAGYYGLNFQTSNGSLALLSNGNFGIGVQIPAAKFHNESGPNNIYAAILASADAGNRLFIKTLNAGTIGGEVFRIGHEFFGDSNNRNNGYISFHRGNSVEGGFLEFGTNGVQRLLINGLGYVGIGSGVINPLYLLDVKGTIHAQQVLVDVNNSWADFVFDKEYVLPKLSEVNAFVQTNGHLPNIPSAIEVKEKGVNVAEMQAKLLQKIEELTLYVIQQDQKIEQLQKQIGNK